MKRSHFVRGLRTLALPAVCCSCAPIDGKLSIATFDELPSCNELQEHLPTEDVHGKAINWNRVDKVLVFASCDSCSKDRVSAYWEDVPTGNYLVVTPDSAEILRKLPKVSKNIQLASASGKYSLTATQKAFTPFACRRGSSAPLKVRTNLIKWTSL